MRPKRTKPAPGSKRYSVAGTRSRRGSALRSSERSAGMIFKKPDDLRFATTEYVIEADNEAYHTFWWRYGELLGAPMKQDGRGYTATIGHIDDRPICVTVFWWIIADTFRVAFVDGTSQLVDHKMIEEWTYEAFAHLHPLWHARHSDAGNMMKVPYDCMRRAKGSAVAFQMRDTRDVEIAARKVGFAP